MNNAYGRADGDVLLAPERDVRTGRRRVPSSQSRRNKRHNRRARTQPKFLVAAVIGAVVVVVGAGIAIAAGSGGTKHRAVAPVGVSPTTPTGPGDSRATATAQLVRVSFLGTPTLVTNTGQYQNLDAGSVAPPLTFLCRPSGCTFVLDGHSFFEGDQLDLGSPTPSQPATNGHWHIVRRGTRSDCSGLPPHTSVATLDLISSRTSSAFGMTVPGHVTGMFTFVANAEVNPGGSPCLDATEIRVKYDSAAPSTFSINPHQIAVGGA